MTREISPPINDPAQLTPIARVLQKQVVPWVQEHGMQRVIIARQSMNDVILPPGAKIHRKKRRGKRVVARGGQDNEAPHVISAYWPDDGQIEMRTPQLICVIEGNSDIHISDYILHCPQSYFVFIPPGLAKLNATTEPHLEGKNKLNGFCDLLWFSLHGRWMQMWICHSKGDEHVHPQFRENVIATDSYPAHLLEALWEGVSEYQEKYDELYKSLLQSLVLSLERNLLEERFLYVNADNPGESYSEAYSGLRDDPISHAHEYIGNHLNENLTLESVAQKVYMSRAQFAKRFHEESGQTFNEFTTQCRLKQAERLLRETDYGIAYISRLVGYKSASHLHNLFTRHHNMTPIKFREEALKAAKEISQSVDNSDDNELS